MENRLNKPDANDPEYYYHGINEKGKEGDVFNTTAYDRDLKEWDKAMSDRWTPAKNSEAIQKDCYKKACKRLASMEKGTSEYARQLEICKMLQI